MEIDVQKEMNKVEKKKKFFSESVGRSCHFMIYDFLHPIKIKNPVINILKKKKRSQTTYYYYEGEIARLNGNRHKAGKTVIQIPAKAVWYYIAAQLKQENRLKEKNIVITINRHTNKNYDITIHKPNTLLYYILYTTDHINNNTKDNTCLNTECGTDYNSNKNSD